MSKSCVNLSGKRVLITQSEDFMGPALCRVFAKQGAKVIADPRPLLSRELPAIVIQEAGEIDALVINLAVMAPSTPATGVEDEEWQRMFAYMVDPLPRLMKAVLPAMLERQAGKIVLMGSAAALRGQRRCSSYSAARGAQLAYIQAVALEVAQKGININAIAQNFVDNPTYFPAEVQANPRFQERLQREVPLGRLVSAEEDAMFAAYLCSDAAVCFVGQVFPMCGGWVTR